MATTQNTTTTTDGTPTTTWERTKQTAHTAKASYDKTRAGYNRIRGRAETHRRTLTPIYTLAATVLTGVVTHTAPWGPLLPLALAVIAAPTATLVARKRSRTYRQLVSLWVGVAVAALTAWTAAAVWFNPVTGPMLTTVTALWAAACAPWWWHTRRRIPTLDELRNTSSEPDAQQPTPEPEPDAPQRDATQRDWDAYVANGGQLPGSELHNPDSFEHGIDYDVALARGKQGFRSLVEAVPMIASALDRDVTDVVPSRNPERKSERWARITVITSSPITGDVTFNGPRVDGGTALLGPYGDGRGEAAWTTYTEDSMWGGVVIGGPGTGKSRLLSNLAISVMSRGDTVIVFIDPKAGGSCPELYDHAHWCGTPDGIADPLLDALNKLVEIRNEENYAVYGASGFVPSPDRPGIMVVIDECHIVFPRNSGTWDQVARWGRSAGIGVVGLSQAVGLETFAGLDSMRLSLMTGNAIIMPIMSNVQGQMMPSLEVDPRTLPDIPGYGYTQASKDTGGRTAPFRNRLVTVDEGQDWMARMPTVDLDPVAANVFAHVAGETYTNRHESAEQAREYSRARIEALRAGDTSVLAGGRPEPPVTPADLAEVTPFPSPRDYFDGGQ